METAPWRFWRFWSKRSRYRPAILEEDLNNLRSAYRDQGFLDVAIEQSGVKIMPSGKGSLDIVINLSGSSILFVRFKISSIFLFSFILNIIKTSSIFFLDYHGS